MSEEVRVAFVGAGLMAREHARAFAALPGVMPAGVYSRTRERAAELAAEFGMPVADSIDALARDSGAKIVVVAVNEPAVPEVCRGVFQHGWQVLLEKPPGHDPATARSLLAMAAAGKADVRVALNRRFYESTTELSSELEESGETRFIQVLDQESPLEARACGHGELVLRNWMYANAIHMVDFLPIFGRGEITDVHVASRWIPDRPCCVVAHVGFSSGDHGSYHGVWEGPGPWAVAVNTVGARYEMRPVEQLTRQVAGSRRAEPVELPGGENGLKPGLLAQARAAVSLARGAETALPTLTTAIRTMELIERIYFPDRR